MSCAALELIVTYVTIGMGSVGLFAGFIFAIQGLVVGIQTYHTNTSLSNTTIEECQEVNDTLSLWLIIYGSTFLSPLLPFCISRILVNNFFKYTGETGPLIFISLCFLLFAGNFAWICYGMVLLNFTSAIANYCNPSLYGVFYLIVMFLFSCFAPIYTLLVLLLLFITFLYPIFEIFDWKDNEAFKLWASLVQREGKQVQEQVLTFNTPTTTMTTDIEQQGLSKVEAMGIRLDHVLGLFKRFRKNDDFYAFCEYVKKTTKRLPEGRRSYASYLQSQDKTKQFVGKANAFVSYPWGTKVQKAYEALNTKYGKKSNEIFIWMDVLMVDEHLASTNNIDFTTWTKTFEGNLKSIGQAIFLLSFNPKKPFKPLAIERIWCGFEQMVVALLDLPYDFTIAPTDEHEILKNIRQGELNYANIINILSEINVEKASTFKKSDQDQILERMRQVGINKVNGIVMNAIKKWLLQIASSVILAEQNMTTKSDGNWIMIMAAGEIHRALGNKQAWEEYYGKVFEEFSQGKKLSIQTQSQLADGLREMGQFANARLVYEQIEESFIRNESQLYQIKAIAKIGLSFYEEQNYEEAVSKYEEAINLEKAAGLEKKYLKTEERFLLYRSTANTYREQKKYNDALKIYEDLVQETREYTGVNDITEHEIIECLLDLSILHERMGEEEKAFATCVESLDRYKARFGDSHPEFARLLSRKADLLEKQGKNEDAESLRKQANNINTRIFSN